MPHAALAKLVKLTCLSLSENAPELTITAAGKEQIMRAVESKEVKYLWPHVVE